MNSAAKIVLCLTTLGFLAAGAIGEGALEPAVLGEGAGAYVFPHTDFISFATEGAETFVLGEQAQTYTATRTVEAFSLNRYETSYRLWWDVRTRAEEHLGYVFQNPGQEGSQGRRGQAPTANEFMPVTAISWYDAAVWCNALSELTGKTPCYAYRGEPLRDSTEAVMADLADCLWDADGYRLPSETEWEFAARKTLWGFQRGDLPSGALSPDTDPGEVAWYNVNTGGNAAGTCVIGTAGSVLEKAAPGSGNANAMGLFDMSGNVLEYCWDWFADYTPEKSGERNVGPPTGAARVSRGGGWSEYTPFVLAGDRYSYDPNECYNYMGFRIASSVHN